MDEAPISSSMSDYAESSTAAMYSRNDDAMTRALRSGNMVGIDELVNLNRQTSPPPVDASSAGTRTTALFSSHKPSTITKPTSAGTSYPVEGYKGKGKAIATYAESLSATHGSGSDTELEAIRDNTLFGVGDWAAEEPGASRTLKGPAKTRRRPRQVRRPKHKKPVVIIQQDGVGSASEEDNAPAVKKVTGRNGKEAKYLRPRKTKMQHDQLDLAEEGRVSEASTSTSLPAKPLTRARFYTLISLIIAIVLTFSLFTFAAHYTGKGRMNCTKGIIFSGTVLVSCFTVLAMVVARRALQEALLAGLLEFLIGFALVIEIHDFM